MAYVCMINVHLSTLAIGPTYSIHALIAGRTRDRKTMQLHAPLLARHGELT